MRPLFNDPRPARLVRSTALAVLLPLAAGVLGVVRYMPPAPLADDAAPARFSAGRAAHDIEAIARAPHPIGSAEHRRVRAYLVERLRALGFATEVQEAIGVNRKSGIAAPIANIVARRNGRGGDGNAILLAAHYDSVPTGPGASDNSAGVAALLETGRWLGTQSALHNDVILLLTDGEEFGMLGAEAFASGHPWAKDVGLVVNLEARGHAGPSILFETSPGNAALIDGAGRNVRSAVANSLTYEVYRRLPNDTDFSVFKRAGMPGVNLAFLGGVTHYHSALDTPANVDRASLQHHGEYLTGLLRAFGDAPFPLPKREDAIYFPAPWAGIVQYAPALALPLAALGLLLVGVLMVQARRSGALRAAAFALAVLRVVALLAGAALAGWLLWIGANRANPNFHWLSNGDAYHTDLLCYGLLAMIAAGVFALAGRRPADRAACWLIWALLALVTAVLAPGASWLFAWALLAGATAQYFAGRMQPTGASVVLALGLMPLAFVAVPIIWLLFSTLGPAMLPAISLFAALCLLPLAPLLENVRGRALYAWLVLAGAGLGGTGLALSGFTADARKPNQVMYLLERTPAELPAARARWFTADDQTDAWSTQYLGAHPVSAPLPELGRSRAVLQAPAPVLNLPVPRVRIVADDVVDRRRQLTLHVETPSDVLTLQSTGNSAVRAVQVEGRRLFDAGDGSAFRQVQVVAPPAAGFDVRFELPAGARLDLRIVQQFWGLPDPALVPPAPRAADMMTAPTRQADSRFTLDRWSE